MEYDFNHYRELSAKIIIVVVSIGIGISFGVFHCSLHVWDGLWTWATTALSIFVLVFLVRFQIDVFKALRSIQKGTYGKEEE